MIVEDYAIMMLSICLGIAMTYFFFILFKLNNESNFGDIPFEDGTYKVNANKEISILKVKDGKIIHIECFDFEKVE